MRSCSLARLALAVPLLALFSVASLSADTSTPLPTRRPVAQVNLKGNEIYYLDAFKADVDHLESGLNAVSAQKVKLASKDKLNVLLDTIDMMLFRQYCDREGIKVADTDIANQLAQMKASLGAGATDAQLEASLRRNMVFTDAKTYVKQRLLFESYIRSKKTNEIKVLSQPTASDVLKAYDDMKFNLRRPATYRITMLRVVTQGKSDADKKKAGDAMRDIANKLKANPNDFDGYLVRGTVDPKGAGYQTALPIWIAKTAESKKQYPAMYDAVFKLKEGEVSDLIEDDTGYSIVRVSAYLPEKQLDFDDTIEGLTSTQAASTNPSATVLQLVASEMQNTKYDQLQKSARDEINTRLRKEGTITLNLANLAEMLDQPEIDALKALKGSGYTIVLQ
jgi:parvulin-like peptidyl-prolyl isomerase